MHTTPDYPAAYVVMTTDAGDHLEGHGLTFTLGRGTEVCVAAINALAPIVIGRTLESITSDMRGFWRAITGEQQLRWIGPEKGAIHLASAALINAVWDLYAKVEGKPLWKLIVDMSPEQLVSCIDFRYISDAVTPDDGRQPGVGGRRGDRQRQAASRIRPFLDRGAHKPRRRARPCHHRARDRTDQSRHGRALPEPGHLQATLPGGRDRFLPARRLPAGGTQRGARGRHPGREIRGAGLPARGRGRAV